MPPTNTSTWRCACGRSNSLLLPYCEACDAPRSGNVNGETSQSLPQESSRAGGGGISVDEFPSVEAAVTSLRESRGCLHRAATPKRASSEVRRLPAPGRVPQKERKKRALEALKGEGKTTSDGEATADKECPADRADDDDFDDATGNYDLMEEALDEEGDVPSYDRLVVSLRQQLQAAAGGQATNRLTDQQVLTRSSFIDIQTLVADGRLRKDDQQHVLHLLEANRLAEKATEGRRRNRSLSKKREKADKKLDRDYVKTEIKNAYCALINQNVRYYNSVAIRVHKGEKQVDVKTIDAVTAHRQQQAEGQEPAAPSKATKEERVMVRRCA